jgi:uncharacterized protein
MNYTLITGATSGIGLELTRQYAKKGCNLILIARRGSLLQDIKKECEAFHVQVELFTCDLSNLDEVESLMENIHANYELNTVIYNAGIGLFAPVHEISKTDLISQQTVNVTAPMLMTKYLVGNIRRNRGSMIYVASILSYWGSEKASVYVSTKHSILGFANSIRLEYPDMHVMTVHPSTVKTNFFKDASSISKKALTPQLVASKIIKGQAKKKRCVNIPKSIGLIRLFYLFFPGLIDKINVKFYTNK